MIKPEELKPFKKFVQYDLGKIYHEKKVKINGTFKEKTTGKVIVGDIFEVNLIGSGSIEETYKAYIKWFNYTKYPNENEREFVSVKKIKELEEND